MLLKYCNYSNCHKLINQNQKYCEEHSKEQQLSRSRRQRNSYQAQRVYNSARWERLSKAIRKRDPYCFDCIQEYQAAKRLNKPLPMVRGSKSVHHIRKIRESESDAWFDANNLVALCDRHHKIRDKR